MKLLLSPHCDDETLFASYTLLRHHPQVLICFNGRRARHLPPDSVREEETKKAMEILRCKVTFARVQCDPAEWEQLELLLKPMNPGRVWAPLPEPGGNLGHNGVGNLAARLWPAQTSFYTTYSGPGNGRTQIGKPVPSEPSWADKKLKALDCYASQKLKSDTAFHFSRPLMEYERLSFLQPQGERLNLGGGINPIRGFKNLDKSNGWLFEDGLGMYADGSIEAITISHALMYVEEVNWPAVFMELERVLKPGGFLRITEDNMESPDSERYKGRSANTRNRRTTGAVILGPAFVRGYMKAVGFDVHNVSPNVSLFYDTSLIQQNHGHPPDVFHLEGIKP